MKNLSSAGKRTARFLLAGACVSYVSYVTLLAFTALRTLRALRWMKTPLYGVRFNADQSKDSTVITVLPIRENYNLQLNPRKYSAKYFKSVSFS